MSWFSHFTEHVQHDKQVVESYAENIEGGSNLDSFSATDYFTLLKQLSDLDRPTVSYAQLNAMLARMGVGLADRKMIQDALLDDLTDKESYTKFKSDINLLDTFLQDQLPTLKSGEFETTFNKLLGDVNWEDYGLNLGANIGGDYEHDVDRLLGNTDSVGAFEPDYLTGEQKYIDDFRNAHLPTIKANDGDYTSSDWYAYNRHMLGVQGSKQTLAAFNILYKSNIMVNVKSTMHGAGIALGHIMNGLNALSPFSWINTFSGRDIFGVDLTQPLTHGINRDLSKIIGKVVRETFRIVNQGIEAATFGTLEIGKDFEFAEELLGTIFLTMAFPGAAGATATTLGAAEVTAATVIKVAQVISAINIVNGVGDTLIYLDRTGWKIKGAVTLLMQVISLAFMFEKVTGTNPKPGAESLMHNLISWVHGGLSLVQAVMMFNDMKRLQEQLKKVQEAIDEEAKKHKEKQDDADFSMDMAYANGSIYNYLPDETGYDYYRSGEPNYYPTTYEPTNIFFKSRLTDDTYDIMLEDTFKYNKYDRWGDTSNYYSVSTLIQYLDRSTQ